MQKPIIASGIFALCAILFLAATFTTGWLSISKSEHSIRFGLLSAKTCNGDICKTQEVRKDELRVFGYALTVAGCLAAFSTGLAGLVLLMHRNRVKGNAAVTVTKILAAIFGTLVLFGGIAMLFVYKESLRRIPDLVFSFSFYLAAAATALTYIAIFMPLTDETTGAQLPQPPLSSQPPLPPPPPDA